MIFCNLMYSCFLFTPIAADYAYYLCVKIFIETMQTSISYTTRIMEELSLKRVLA